jgi:hypothetical protein
MAMRCISPARSAPAAACGLDKNWVDDEIDAEVRSHGFRFDFPLVGNVDWNPFD